MVAMLFISHRAAAQKGGQSDDSHIHQTLDWLPNAPGRCLLTFVVYTGAVGAFVAHGLFLLQRARPRDVCCRAAGLSPAALFV